MCPNSRYGSRVAVENKGSGGSHGVISCVVVREKSPSSSVQICQLWNANRCRFSSCRYWPVYSNYGEIHLFAPCLRNYRKREDTIPAGQMPTQKDLACPLLAENHIKNVVIIIIGLIIIIVIIALLVISSQLHNLCINLC